MATSRANGAMQKALAKVAEEELKQDKPVNGGGDVKEENGGENGEGGAGVKTGSKDGLKTKAEDIKPAECVQLAVADSTGEEGDVKIEMGSAPSSRESTPSSISSDTDEEINALVQTIQRGRKRDAEAVQSSGEGNEPKVARLQKEDRDDEDDEEGSSASEIASETSSESSEEEEELDEDDFGDA